MDGFFSAQILLFKQRRFPLHPHFRSGLAGIMAHTKRRTTSTQQCNYLLLLLDLFHLWSIQFDGIYATECAQKNGNMPFEMGEFRWASPPTHTAQYSASFQNSTKKSRKRSKKQYSRQAMGRHTVLYWIAPLVACAARHRLSFHCQTTRKYHNFLAHTKSRIKRNQQFMFSFVWSLFLPQFSVV